MENGGLVAITVHTNAEQTTFLNLFGEGLDPTNRWMVLKDLVPWDEIERSSDEFDSADERTGGRPTIPLRVALGALIIKEALRLTDRETVAQIQENPYLQAFLGFASYSSAKPFDASSLVHFRKRIGSELVDALNRVVVAQFQSSDAVTTAPDETASDDDDDVGPDAPGRSSDGGIRDDASDSPDGTLMLDATCAPADITHPTDLGLLNHAREVTERVIDRCHGAAGAGQRKPRTYRKQARAAYLRTVKKKRCSTRDRRRGLRKQLQYIRRNLGHIDRLVADGAWTLDACGPSLRQFLETVRIVYAQQETMYRTRTRTIENRIYSIAQPHVRAIYRSKLGRSFEFGAKISASHVDGFAFIERLSWDPYNEKADLIAAAESYRDWHGHYPERILADKIYRTRANRAWCKAHGIRLAGIGPGRPPKDARRRADLRREAVRDEADRQPMEGVFGRGKRRFGLDRIMTRLAETSATTISIVFLVMNLFRILALLLALSGAWLSRRWFAPISTMGNGTIQRNRRSGWQGQPARWVVGVAG